MDGLADILMRMQNASVLDIGCNRGRTTNECVEHGAKIVHGCDIDPDCMVVANHWFADDRSIEARFEVCDLTGGPAALKKAFGEYYRTEYDFVMMLAVYHKLRRVMKLDALLYLVDHLLHHCGRFFVWRGSREELIEIEPVIIQRDFKRVHYSEICECADLPGEKGIRQQPAAAWAKTKAF